MHSSGSVLKVLPQKNLDEKLAFHILNTCLKSFISHKFSAPALEG